MRLLPKSKLGKYSVIFLTFFLFSTLCLHLLAITGQQGGDNFVDNLWLASSGFGAAISAVCAFISALLAVVKYKERSILIIVAILVGFLVSLFVAGEILFPH